MNLFDRLQAAGNTIVLVTHEHDIAARARRIISRPRRQGGARRTSQVGKLRNQLTTEARRHGERLINSRVNEFNGHLLPCTLLFFESLSLW